MPTHFSVTLFVPSLTQSFIRPHFAAVGKSLLPLAKQKDVPESQRTVDRNERKKIPSQKKLNFLATAQPTQTRQQQADQQASWTACALTMSTFATVDNSPCA